MKATKQQIEQAADAIKFLVPLYCEPHLNGDALSAWSPKGLAVVKWPRGFAKDEQKLIRKIAKTVIEAL